MKVICMFDMIKSPIATVTGNVEYGNTYTVKAEHSGYSEFGKRYVEAYEFYETEGYFEKGIFIPIDENKFDTVLKKVLKVPKKNKNVPKARVS